MCRLRTLDTETLFLGNNRQKTNGSQKKIIGIEN